MSRWALGHNQPNIQHASHLFIYGLMGDVVSSLGYGIIKSRRMRWAGHVSSGYDECCGLSVPYTDWSCLVVMMSVAACLCPIQTGAA
jgi:hypothetical protein